LHGITALRLCEILDSMFCLFLGSTLFRLDSTFWLDSTLKLYYVIMMILLLLLLLTIIIARKPCYRRESSATPPVIRATQCCLTVPPILSFYRAMLYAERGHATVCRLSIYLSTIVHRVVKSTHFHTDVVSICLRVSNKFHPNMNFRINLQTKMDLIYNLNV